MRDFLTLTNYINTVTNYINKAAHITKDEHCFQISDGFNVEIQNLRSKKRVADDQIAQHVFFASKES